LHKYARWGLFACANPKAMHEWVHRAVQTGALYMHTEAHYAGEHVPEGPITL